MLLGAVLMFGGVYVWGGLTLAAALAILGLGGTGGRIASQRATLDMALACLLAAVLLQATPLPAPIVQFLSPARHAFLSATVLQEADSRFVPLTLDTAATLHAWVSLLCIVGTFWVARRVFARGGVRTFVTIIGCGAIAIVVIAFAQQASTSGLIYGFWRPRDAGARPMGPFINRNHLGTWSIMAICLCAGYLQWSAPRAMTVSTWRARLAGWLDGRRLVLQLAVVLLASVIAVGASRSSLVALACAVGYVAVAAPRGLHGRSRRVSLGLLAALALAGMFLYGDGERLLLRMDETRSSGMANRLAIWRDAVPIARDFPITGAGAGAFGSAMRVYQTSPRMYYHNEAHNQYLQVVVEGGLLLIAPVIVGAAAFFHSAWRELRRPGDPLRWLRVAAAAGLVGAGVQSIWETGLTVPANGMLAATLAALLIQPPRPSHAELAPTAYTDSRARASAPDRDSTKPPHDSTLPPAGDAWRPGSAARAERG